MNLTKKTTLTLIAVFLVGVIAGVFAGVQFAPKTVVVTVEEAISIAPDSVSVTLYVGESKSADFIIHNIASVDIPLTVLAEVTAFPEGGSAADLTLNYPQTLSALASSDTTLTIAFSLATQAVPGDYTITVTTTRV